MGNALLRVNRWRQNTREMPWSLSNHNLKQRTSRRWGCHIDEGCFCLPWKKIPIFKARQDFPKESEGTPSATNQQGDGDQSPAEGLCYVLIDHRASGRRPSGLSAELLYENVAPWATSLPPEPWAGCQAEYSALRVPSKSRHQPCPENEYEFLELRRASPHALQQLGPFIPASGVRVSHL